VEILPLDFKFGAKTGHPCINSRHAHFRFEIEVVYMFGMLCTNLYINDLILRCFHLVICDEFVICDKLKYVWFRILRRFEGERDAEGIIFYNYSYNH